MEKVRLHLFDTRRNTYSELVSLTNLSDDDLKSLEKYRSIDVKKEKLVSLYIKKKYIGEFSVNEFGKPVSNKIHFNLSHCSGVVVIGISENREIGVDVEVVKSVDQDLVKYVSNDEEYQYIKNEYDFISIWTNKESLVKCLGTGIKNKIKLIPGLPLNGSKEFEGKKYYSRIIKNNDAIISVTLDNEKEFDVELLNESFI